MQLWSRLCFCLCLCSRQQRCKRQRASLCCAVNLAQQCQLQEQQWQLQRLWQQLPVPEQPEEPQQQQQCSALWEQQQQCQLLWQQPAVCLSQQQQPELAQQRPVWQRLQEL